jgi:hypothetical protein
MNELLMINLEHEKNGRVYRMVIPMMQQSWSEAHEVALDFANKIIEMSNREIKKPAEQPSEPVVLDVQPAPAE